MTVMAIAAFALAVALGLLAIGPPVMKALFGQSFEYGRVGLALIGLGMGMHLTSGALNQAALARNQARTAATCWIVAAVVFVAWMLVPLVSEELLRTEIGYLGATSLLALMLGVVYRRGTPPRRRRVNLTQGAPASTRSGECDRLIIGATAHRGNPIRPRRRPLLSRGRQRLGRARRRWPSRPRTGWRRPLDSGPAVAGSTPPSTSSATSSREDVAQTLDLVERVLYERLSPPARVDRHAQCEVDRVGKLRERPDGRGWVDRDADAGAPLAHEIGGVGDVRGGLGVEGDRVGAGLQELGDLALGSLDHQVHVEQRPDLLDLLAQRRDDESARA